VSPYFQVLALIKSFQRTVHPTLLKQELQTIKCSKQHTLLIGKLIKFVKLTMWWLSQTNDTHIRELRRFESMYTMQGKTRPTRHTLPTLSPRMAIDHTYLMWSTHSILSWSRQQIWWEACGVLVGFFPAQSTNNPQLDDRLICESIPSFSPTIANEVVGKRQASIDN
jgi:hypothetical protein